MRENIHDLKSKRIQRKLSTGKQIQVTIGKIRVFKMEIQFSVKASHALSTSFGLLVVTCKLANLLLKLEFPFFEIPILSHDCGIFPRIRKRKCIHHPPVHGPRPLPYLFGFPRTQTGPRVCSAGRGTSGRPGLELR